MSIKIEIYWNFDKYFFLCIMIITNRFIFSIYTMSLSETPIHYEKDHIEHKHVEYKPQIKETKESVVPPYTIEEAFGDITVKFWGDVSLTLSDWTQKNKKWEIISDGKPVIMYKSEWPININDMEFFPLGPYITTKNALADAFLKALNSYGCPQLSVDDINTIVWKAEQFSIKPTFKQTVESVPASAYEITYTPDKVNVEHGDFAVSIEKSIPTDGNLLETTTNFVITHSTEWIITEKELENIQLSDNEKTGNPIMDMFLKTLHLYDFPLLSKEDSKKIESWLIS